jgi:hypothetical protein
MKKTPLATVKERFESKEKLVAAVQSLTSSDLWVDRLGAKGLSRVSNAKLLSLHDKLSDAKTRFKTRESLIDAILAMAKHSKDTGLRAALGAYPLPRLLDLHASLTKKSKRVAKAGK